MRKEVLPPWGLKIALTGLILLASMLTATGVVFATPAPGPAPAPLCTTPQMRK
jgi:hypothetical protein